MVADTEHFATFLRDHRAEILARWEDEVRALPPASKLPRRALLDHLPVLLDEIADAAALIADGGGYWGGQSGAERHALARLDEGFDLAEVVTEYSLLRRLIHELWLKEPGVRVDALEVFNRVLDAAIGEAASRYSHASKRALEAVDRMSKMALGSTSVGELLRSLLKLIQESCAAVDEVTIMLREGDRLYVREAVGITTERDAAFSLAIGEGFAGTVAATKQPLLLKNAATDPLVKSQFLKDLGIKAIYGVPLVDGDTIGVAHMGSLTAYDFSDEDMLVFGDMATRATALLIEARLKEELRHQAQRQELILKTAKLGVWEWDLKSDKVKLDEQSRRLYGVAEGGDVDAKTLVRAIAPIDRDRVWAEARKAIDEGTDFRSQFLIQHLDDGSEVHVRSRGGVTKGNTHMLGVIVDRSEEHGLELERELYLAALGHDLRNPLNVVAFGADHLLRDETLPESATKVASRIGAAASRMQRMIEQLLDFARARAGQPMTLDRRSVDLADLMQVIVEQMEMIAPNRKIEQRRQGSTVVECDPDRMSEVFQNLVWNADRYGDSTSPIRIQLHGLAESVQIQVHNVGPPIAEELLPVLFDPFRRGARGEGLGLGLYIVRHIVDAHGGTVAVTSSNEDGTRVTVVLPRTQR